MYSYMNSKTYDITYSEDTLIIDGVLIDPEIIKAISILNKGGYKTKMSSSGHYDIHRLTSSLIKVSPAVLDVPYIMFENGIHLPSIPEGWSKTVDEEILDEYGQKISGHWESIFSHAARYAESEEDFSKKKNEAIKNLEIWTQELSKYILNNS